MIKLMTTNAGYTNSKREVLNMVDFGIKLAKLRENKRLSQSQLAARLGITKSMVSAYENSARMPSYAAVSYTHLDVYKRQDCTSPTPC